MSTTLPLELEIFRDVLAAVAAGERVIEIVVGADIWWRLHAERPQYGYLFVSDPAKPHRGSLGSTPVRRNAATKHWRVITAHSASFQRIHAKLH